MIKTGPTPSPLPLQQIDGAAIDRLRREGLKLRRRPHAEMASLVRPRAHLWHTQLR